MSPVSVERDGGGGQEVEQKHESGVGDVRSNFESTTKTQDFMQSTCSPPQLSLEMRERRQVAPQLSFQICASGVTSVYQIANAA